MKREITYIMSLRQAFDGGREVQLQFCTLFKDGEPQYNNVIIDGELHRCEDFKLFDDSLSFFAIPTNAVEADGASKFKCVLCHQTIYNQWGCNPEPLAPVTSRCCDDCDKTVLQSRLAGV